MAALEERTRPTRVGRPRLYLLTGGMAVCAALREVTDDQGKVDLVPCGNPLEARPSETGRRSYVCSSASTGPTGRRGCGKIRIVADGLEDHVGVQILARLASPRDGKRVSKALLTLEREQHTISDQLTGTQDRLQDAMSRYTDGTLPGGDFYPLRDQLRRRIRELEATLDRAQLLDSVPAFDPAQLAGWWESAPLKRRRALLGLMVEEVRVHSTRLPGSRTFDPGRVEIVWR